MVAWMFSTSRNGDVVIQTEQELAGLAISLGAAELGAISVSERALASCGVVPSKAELSRSRKAISSGLDPLGEYFCKLRSPAERRPVGATYTPHAIVSAMTSWASSRKPIRVVDPGAGSGRFIIAAGRSIPGAELVAVETDPLAALLCRAHLVAAGFAKRARVITRDYRRLELPAIGGPTVFLLSLIHISE